MLSDLLIRLRALFRRNAVEAELDDELRFHFDQQVEKHMHSGLTREEATRQTRLIFGTLDRTKEECRDARGVHFLETLAQDVRYAARAMARNRGFTLVLVAILALGIGGTTAMYSVVDAVLLRPLPFPRPNELMVIARRNVSGGNRRSTIGRTIRRSTSLPNISRVASIFPRKIAQSGFQSLKFQRTSFQFSR